VVSILYGLYVFHYPLLIQWDFAQSPVGLVVSLLMLVGLSMLGDRYLDRVIPKPQAVRSDDDHATKRRQPVGQL
jgi:hypothetical protein